MNKDKKVRLIKIFSHILETLFLWWILFLWFYFDNIKVFMTVCVPTTILFGLTQGISKVWINILKENSKNIPTGEQ